MTRLNPEQTQTMKEELTVELCRLAYGNLQLLSTGSLGCSLHFRNIRQTTRHRIWLLLPERRLRFLISEKMK